MIEGNLGLAWPRRAPWVLCETHLGPACPLTPPTQEAFQGKMIPGPSRPLPLLSRAESRALLAESPDGYLDLACLVEK
jgi:hypothetical protein